MNINNVMWFTNKNGCIGIVQVDDEYDGIRYYISSVEGVNEEYDKRHVAEWGASFPKYAGDALFGIL